jgi:geranylgeranyl diphosphate synthase type II
VRTADELRELVETYLTELPLHATPEAPGLAEAVRYPLAGGGKRLRPVLCLAVAEAAGARAEDALPAAAAVELVHTFSLVHDDLPALDDDATRRGRPSAHVAFGEAVAILAGDALLAHAFELAASYETTGPARELARATLGMIGGQYVDVAAEKIDVLDLHRLKTGRLFGAAVGCALEIAHVSREAQLDWRDFADRFGILFQLVDDLEDEDGAVAGLGAVAVLALVAEQRDAAAAALAEVPADTAVVAGLLDELAARAV